MSDRLAQRLSAHRTAALQIEVARHPQVALAAVVHGMVQAVLQRDRYHRDGLPLDIRLTVQDRLESIAPDWPESHAAVALRKLQQVAGGKLPQDRSEEHTSALQSLMRISYAVFCLLKTKKYTHKTKTHSHSATNLRHN